jgi:hypothetical protein
MHAVTECEVFWACRDKLGLIREPGLFTHAQEAVNVKLFRVGVDFGTEHGGIVHKEPLALVNDTAVG